MPDEDQELDVEVAAELATEMLVKASRPLVYKAMQQLFVWRKRVGERVGEHVRNLWPEK